MIRHRRHSMFELEEKLRLERARHLRLINTTLVGAMVGVSWSYIVEQLADPYGECPARGCWVLIVLLACSLVAGAFGIPLVQLGLQRSLGEFLGHLEALDSRRERLSPYAVGGLRGAAGVLAVERHSIFAPRSASRYGFRRAVVGKLLLLLTNAGDSAFVVTAANLLYYLTKQLEFVALSGRDTPSVSSSSSRGHDRSFSVAKGGDLETYASVAGICAAVCLVAAFASVCLAVKTADRLAVETDDYRVRLWLLLSTHPHYPAAYALSIALGVVLFSPLELGYGEASLRAVLAFAQMALFFTGGRFLSRRFQVPPSDPERRLAEAGSSPWTCASFVAHDGCAVVAAIGVQNFLDFCLRAQALPTVLAFYAVYTPSLLANAHFRHRRRLQKIREHQDDDDDAALAAATTHRQELPPLSTRRGDPSSHIPKWCAPCIPTVRDARFEDTAELWLITLGFWAPYTYVLYFFWESVILKTSDPYTTLLLRILQQIAIAAGLTLVVAFLAGILVLCREFYAGCFLTGVAAKPLDDLDDGQAPHPLDQHHDHNFTWTAPNQMASSGAQSGPNTAPAARCDSTAPTTPGPDPSHQPTRDDDRGLKGPAHSASREESQRAEPAMPSERENTPAFPFGAAFPPHSDDAALAIQPSHSSTVVDSGRAAGAATATVSPPPAASRAYV